MENVKILVIEDDDDIREVVVDTLHFKGYETIEAADGLMGIEQAKKTKPDLIICDVMMPELDGYGVLLALSEHIDLAPIPFIFLTAKANPNDLRRGMNLGADDYVVKPFEASELLDAVQTRLDRQRVMSSVMSDKVGMLQRYINLHLPHELRTPLTGVRGYISMLQMDWQDLPPDQVQSMLDTVESSAERLQLLIENYTVYSQLQILLFNKELANQLKQYSFVRQPAELVRIVAELAARRFGVIG